MTGLRSVHGCQYLLKIISSVYIMTIIVSLLGVLGKCIKFTTIDLKKGGTKHWVLLNTDCFMFQ